MAVLVTAEVPGQTRQGYDAMLTALEEALASAPGFVLHTSHPIEGGWRILEVWRSRGEADRWYAQHVAPKLPPGIHPTRWVHDLHSLVHR